MRSDDAKRKAGNNSKYQDIGITNFRRVLDYVELTTKYALLAVLAGILDFLGLNGLKPNLLLFGIEGRDMGFNLYTGLVFRSFLLRFRVPFPFQFKYSHLVNISLFYLCT
jgi:hypothetical protein